MNKLYTILVTTIFISSGVSIQAQEKIEAHNPPVNIETMFANKGIVMQAMINKKILSVPKLGFFSVTSLISNWDENKLTDFMNQSSLTFEVVKGLNITGGYHYTENTGFRGTAGLLYSFGMKDFTAVLYPRIDLSKNSNFESFAMVEYKPKLNDKISFYSRIQGLYTYRFNDNMHQRSYIMARVGISYKEYLFGLGGNIDYFGPMKQNINNFGVFAAFNLF